MEFSQQDRVVADACKEMGLPLAELRTLPLEYHYTSLQQSVIPSAGGRGVISGQKQDVPGAVGVIQGGLTLEWDTYMCEIAS